MYNFNTEVVTAVLALLVGIGGMHTYHLVTNKPHVIDGAVLKVLEYICKKNDGVKEFVRTNGKYNIKCIDGAQFLDVEMNVKDDKDKDKKDIDKLNKMRTSL